MILRVRFKVRLDDPRPIKWPIKYPYWISGQGDDYYILVAYVDNEQELLENWPEAEELDIEEEDRIVFTDRFQKPEWYEE